MITIGEAKAKARNWVEELPARMPDFVGAFVVGSTMRKADSEIFSPSSDLDLRIVLDREIPDSMLDPEGPLSLRKFLYDGVVLEPAYISWASIRESDAVLSDLYLGAALRDPGIIADPFGRIAILSERVVAEFARRKWIRRRIDSSLAGARAFGLLATSAPPVASFDPLCFHSGCALNAVSCASLVPIVAALEPPTTRKSFVVARSVLVAHGRGDLAELLLRLLGSAGMGKEDVMRHHAELASAFDAATTVPHKKFHIDYDITPQCRDIVIGGSAELIVERHREAMYFIAFFRSVAQMILLSETDSSLREKHAESFAGLLESMGLGREGELIPTRIAELNAALPTLEAAAEEIVDQSDAAFD
jgi:hypothetical protein